jgi:hypothetical protein
VKLTYLFVLFGLICCFVMPAARTEAQDNRVVYLLSITHHNQYTWKSRILTWNPLNDDVEVLLTILNRYKGETANLYLESEVKAFEAWRDVYNTPQVIESMRLLPLMNYQPQVSVRSITVSPDNHQVIAEVQYSFCLHYPSEMCYGTTQLLLIDRIAHTSRVIAKLGIHDDRFLVPGRGASTSERSIRDIQWMPNQQAIILKFDVDFRLPRIPIVIIPLNGDLPFRLAVGNAWAISADSRQVVVVNNQGAFARRFDLFTGKLESGIFSTSTYELDERDVIVDDAGMGFLGSNLIFSKMLNYVDLFDYFISGLAIFDPESQYVSLIVPEWSISRITSIKQGAAVLAETPGHLLVEITQENELFRFTTLFIQPVEFWNVNDYGELIVMFPRSQVYQVLSDEGQEIAQFDLFHLNQLYAEYGFKLDGINQLDW